MSDLEATAAGDRSARRGAQALLAAFLCLAALPAWYATIDQPWLRSTGSAAWFLLGAGVAIGLHAGRIDRRAWVRILAGLDVLALAGFAWLFFGVARLPNRGTALELERAPDFELASSAGGTVRLSDELARGPVHLVFFRGPW
jgi:hypothetical protein